MEPQAPYLSVSQLIAVSNQVFETALPLVYVEGEVVSFKVNQGKFVFFDLKDSSGSVNCFMMVYQLRTVIEDGMKVIISGKPKLTNWGKFSVTVTSIAPHGEGSLKRSADLLRIKLYNEGLFDQLRKRPLPSMPQHVGIITSPDSAGFADFKKIISNRWGGMNLSVASVQVQGDAARDQIIRAVQYFNSQNHSVEVTVIIRGGGSAQDLSTFNDEALVRSIAASRIPTLVGVGHETDTSLADLAADVRASTPSNAAELLVPDKNEIIRRNQRFVYDTLPLIHRQIEKHEHITDQLLRDAHGILIASHESAYQILKQLKIQLYALSPIAILERGYAVLRGHVQHGAEVTIETHKNYIDAEVINVRNK